MRYCKKCGAEIPVGQVAKKAQVQYFNENE